MQILLTGSYRRTCEVGGRFLLDRTGCSLIIVVIEMVVADTLEVVDTLEVRIMAIQAMGMRVAIDRPRRDRHRGSDEAVKIDTAYAWFISKSLEDT
jgi:hypothetical protein